MGSVGFTLIDKPGCYVGSETTCDRSHKCRTPSGILASYRYPMLVTTVDCKWVITTEVNTFVKLDIIDAVVEARLPHKCGGNRIEFTEVW